MITLGKKYTDRVTGFEGIATGYVMYLTGCNQALLAPRVGTDGAHKESQWFDVQRLAEVENVPALSLEAGGSPGPDRAAPKR